MMAQTGLKLGSGAIRQIRVGCAGRDLSEPIIDHPDNHAAAGA
jgi:hypothetical protein